MKRFGNIGFAFILVLGFGAMFFGGWVSMHFSLLMASVLSKRLAVFIASLLIALTSILIATWCQKETASKRSPLLSGLDGATAQSALERNKLLRSLVFAVAFGIAGGALMMVFMVLIDVVFGNGQKA